jgi:WhiB family redox-sensing transcriptional regulator
MAWEDHARCAGRGELFFGPDGETQDEMAVREARAKAICACCPVTRPCLEYGLRLPTKYGSDGLYGGRNPAQLQSLRRSRAHRKAAA